MERERRFGSAFGPSLCPNNQVWVTAAITPIVNVDRCVGIRVRRMSGFEHRVRYNETNQKLTAFMELESAVCGRQWPRAGAFSDEIRVLDSRRVVERIIPFSKTESKVVELVSGISVIVIDEIPLPTGASLKREKEPRNPNVNGINVFLTLFRPDLINAIAKRGRCSSPDC